jgi:hypothetical protein
MPAPIVEWFDWRDGHNGADAGSVTIAHVRYAQPGETEGGLGAFARFFSPAAAAVPLSPAGWYWQGTVETRGVWNRPQGPFDSPELAIADCMSADWKIE